VLRKLMGISPSSPVRILVVQSWARFGGHTVIVSLAEPGCCCRRRSAGPARTFRDGCQGAGVIATGVRLVTLLNGVIVRSILNGLDRLVRARDSLIAARRQPPRRPIAAAVRLAGALERARSMAGATSRPVDGRGKSAPSPAAALRPLRAYVGCPLRHAMSAPPRARELKRIGGFERCVLVLITPTAPAGRCGRHRQHRVPDAWRRGQRRDAVLLPVQPIDEFFFLRSLHRPGDGARAVREIYGYWHSLRTTSVRSSTCTPQPRCQNSEWSFEFFELMGDPSTARCGWGRPGPRGTGAQRPRPATRARPRGVRSFATARSCGS